MSKAPNTFVYDYVRLYTDDLGETRFGEAKLRLEGESFRNGPPVLVHRLALAAGESPTLAHIPAGSSFDWHNTVRRQFIFVVQGTVDFIASDGSVCRAVPGSLILFEDLAGKGHRTQCVGPDDHVALSIPVTE